MSNLRGRRRTARTIFISYNFNTGGSWGFGNNTEFTTKNNSITLKDLKEIETKIKEKYGYKNVVVMNYRIM